MDNLSSTIAAENATPAAEEASYKSQTTQQAKIQDNVESDVAEEQNSNVSKDLKDYYDHIYTIKIDRIDIEKDGISFDPGIQLSDIVCGTGFMLDNGTFVTDRQNVEPWVFTNTEWKELWRRL